ncbi:hypothetical protein ZIOFF_022255 [Zingiber officinale]|uniref:Uncharacterized protein n=1 Tax=Zingiber officinale TaxID=94328 RepID=A0A8J5H8A5_ZINOF|nr:hypothetical protein ZIOFF_022255 [Zingiber officinale]
MGRSRCCEKTHINKGAWTKEEDSRLVAYIRAHGEGCWRSLPQAAGLLRCGKSCRLRWINYLRPGLKRGNFTEKEDELIIKLHSHHGNKWSLIAGRLPGRTDNEIKNHWNTHIKRKLTSRGIDPATHQKVCAPITNLSVSFVKVEEKKGGFLRCDQDCTSSRGSNDKGRPWQSESYKCPDLNLDLNLTPPPLGGIGFCINCSWGLHLRSEECKCDTFHGIKSQLWDTKALKFASLLGSSRLKWGYMPLCDEVEAPAIAFIILGLKIMAKEVCGGGGGADVDVR